MHASRLRREPMLVGIEPVRLFLRAVKISRGDVESKLSGMEPVTELSSASAGNIVRPENVAL